jgi:RND family efflux transporter MFP subunit
MSLNIKRIILPPVVIIVAIAIAFVISNSKPEVKKRSHHKKVLVVETIMPKPQTWSATLKTQGTVEARTMTTLTSRVSGEVMWVSDELRPGGFFEKGDRLLKIEAIDYELAIKSAEAELAEARFIHQEEKAQSAQASLNWKRLGRKEVASELVLRKPQLAKAKAVVDSAKATLQRAKLDLKRTVIRAPYAGRIVAQYVDVGQFVSSGKELLQLFAIDRVEVRLPLSEKQREQLDLPSFYRGESLKVNKKSLPIMISARIGGVTHQWQARFSRVEGVMSRETRQQYIVAEIENPYQRNEQGRPPLEVGQYVQAQLKGRENIGFFIIPRSAVQGENEVMVVDSQNRVQRRTIELVGEEGSSVVVRKGLSEGDRLCTSYIPFVANNTVVRLASEKGHSMRPTKGETK